MKCFFLISILGCLFTTVAQAQDTIYVNEHHKWCSKEKADSYVVVTSSSPLTKVDSYTMEGKLTETTYYIRYVEEVFQCIKEGESTLYYEDGSIKATAFYSNGKLQSVKAYYPDGKLQREDSYTKKGKLKKSFLYNKEGKPTKNREPWERQPEFPGGDIALMNAVSSILKYPEDASKAYITGRVILQFVIDKEGKMTQAKVVRPTYYSLDKEALRVINEIGRKYTWKPGIEHGEKISVRYTVPISFNLK